MDMFSQSISSPFSSSQMTERESVGARGSGSSGNGISTIGHSGAAERDPFVVIRNSGTAERDPFPGRLPAANERGSSDLRLRGAAELDPFTLRPPFAEERDPFTSLTLTANAPPPSTMRRRCEEGAGPRGCDPRATSVARRRIVFASSLSTHQP